MRADGELLELGNVRHKSGKKVSAWAMEGDCDPATLRSNTFEMEWPPKSGKKKEFPEIDRARFFFGGGRAGEDASVGVSVCGEIGGKAGGASDVPYLKSRCPAGTVRLKLTSGGASPAPTGELIAACVSSASSSW